MSFTVDPAFAVGSIAAAEWPLCHVRLEPAARATLMEEVVRAGAVVRRMASAPVDKLNVAALGNVTAQLHVHVVGRRRDDGLWPDPVWGRPGAVAMAPPERARRLALIAAEPLSAAG